MLDSTLLTADNVGMIEQFNMLDWIMVLICAFFAIKAISKGFLRELGSLVGLVLAIWGGFSFYQTVADFLRRVVGKQDFWWEALAFILCFVIIYIIVISIFGRISKVIYASSISVFNRLLGGALGLVKGVIFCFILINLLLMMLPIAKGLDENQTLQENLVTESHLAPLVARAGQTMLSFLPEDEIVHHNLDFVKQQTSGLADSANSNSTDNTNNDD